MRVRCSARWNTLLILATTLAVAPGALRAADPAEDAMRQIRPEALRAHIRFLAGDLLEGRGTGTPGYGLAANYVAAQFEALGLEPAGGNGTYFQPVALRQIEILPEQNSLTLVRNGQEQPLAIWQDFFMTAYEFAPESAVEAPVVFVGFGVTAPELNYDDYAGVDVRGRIVAYLSGAPPRFASLQRAFYSDRAVKRTNAATHGAAGILVIRPPMDERRQPWEWMVPQRKAPGVWWLDENGKPNDAEPSIRGQATLNRSAAEALFAGAPQSLEEVFAAAEASRPQAFPLAVEARLRVSGRHIQLESPNVAAVLRGSDAQLRNEYVVYTAHLDHLGICRPAETDAICNGAYDNASGVAMMLEVARAFARLPLPPKRSMIFLAVTGEEKGLLGSDYFAHYPTVPPAQIVANINIDEPPLLYPLRDIVAFGAEDSSLGTVVAEAAARLGVALSPDPMPEEVLFVRSDQFSFVRQGVPAVFLFQGFQSSDPSVDGRAVFERWERERYHAPGDDASQPFDFATGVKAAQLNFLIGYQVARQTERPAWKPGDFFGEKFGRRR